MTSIWAVGVVSAHKTVLLRPKVWPLPMKRCFSVLKCGACPVLVLNVGWLTLFAYIVYTICRKYENYLSHCAGGGVSVEWEYYSSSL